MPQPWVAQMKSDACKITQSPDQHLQKWEDISAASYVTWEFIILVKIEEANISLT